jgi:hypothetical protein
MRQTQYTFETEKLKPATCLGLYLGHQQTVQDLVTHNV